jgi:hypothetical protein
MVLLRFAGDAHELLPRWERAVDLWHVRYPEYQLPATVVAEGEGGGLVVVNVFASDADHVNFGQKMGTPLREAGLATPELEHLAVKKIAWDVERRA